MTIVRTIGRYTFENQTVNVRGPVDFGLVLVTNDAEAALIFPDPNISDEQPGWWHRDRFVIAGGAADAPESKDVFFDIRSKRKFAGEDIDAVMVINTGSSTAITVTGLTRLLCLKA